MPIQKLNQLSMFDDVPEKIPWNRDEMVFSFSFDQDKILRDIIRLYNNGQPFDVDTTYSSGVMWKKLPQPRQKFDLHPQTEDTKQADATSLPLLASTIGSLMFDPPFKASNSKVKGIIEKRFTAFSSPTALWEFYRVAFAEFWRVLSPGGIFVIKCQDTVSSGVNHWSHYEVEKMAREQGFDQLDLFVLGKKSVLLSPNMRNQQHARKNHSYLIVFQKPYAKSPRGKKNHDQREDT